MPRNSPKFKCENCHYLCYYKSDLDKHLTTHKHKSRIEDTEKLADISLYKCDQCEYTSIKKSDLKKHFITNKHNSIAFNDSQENITKINNCGCGKTYKYSSGLWRHQKKCNYKENLPIEPCTELTNELVCIDSSNLNNSGNKLIVSLLKDNADFKHQILDLLKNHVQTPTTINNTSNNVLHSSVSHNSNTNNITVNMFLNEYCKNAMTLEAFMNSIEISMDDILYMAKRGNREGLTMILKNAFNQLQITERPVHCTDKKRHTTYIKEDAGWTKDSEQQFLGKLCRKTEHKGMQLAMKTINEDPEYKERGTDKYELRIPIMYETIGGKEGAEYNHPLVIRSLEEHLDLDKKMILETIEELKKI